MRTIQIAAINCVSCERCQVESVNPWFERDETQTGLGIHARPSGKLVKLAGSFESEVKITCGERTESAKSIIGIMMANLGPGKVFTLQVDGPDEADATVQICSLLRHGFFEPLCPDFEDYLLQSNESSDATSLLNRSAEEELQGFASLLKLTGKCSRGVPCI